jgi:pyridoxal phosphate enzyme (YggS family)
VTLPVSDSASIPTDVGERLAVVQDRVAVKCRASGRAPGDVTLIAVSKTHGSAPIKAALAAGQRHFGENRVQEAAQKWPAIRGATADIRLHLIGPLQTNKVSEAVALFDVIHTLDRPRLAEKLAEEMMRQSRRLPCFVQVNTGREPQKAGIDPTEADNFITAARGTWNLDIAGLMCIPPVTEQAAIHFAFLREIAARNGLAQLSMGMSDDFETAIAFGATHIRVGSAIFGARHLG